MEVNGINKVPLSSPSAMSKRIAEMYWRVLGLNVKKVLDIGCGHGGFGKWKPERARVTGIDRDPLALENARIYYDSVCEINLEEEELPFEAESFDGVLARDVLEHLREPWGVVLEIYRVLRPEGKVISSVPMAKPKVVWNDYTHIRGFTKKAFQRLFEHGGFQVKSIYPIVGFNLSSKLRLTRYLPLIMKAPGVGLFAVSYQLVAIKPKD